MVLAVITLVAGYILMWILAWLTAPVRVVRTALKHVEQGDLDCNLVVFDGTELGELQRGFNSMVEGLKERERVRDLTCLAATSGARWPPPSNSVPNSVAKNAMPQSFSSTSSVRRSW
jgi:HAMP domain-containing protein